jgi:hypothetical protein
MKKNVLHIQSLLTIQRLKMQKIQKKYNIAFYLPLSGFSIPEASGEWKRVVSCHLNDHFMMLVLSLALHHCFKKEVKNPKNVKTWPR